MQRGVPTITFALFFSVGIAAASADGIDSRAKQLRSGSYKIRLSAALYLADKSDPRAVVALAHALKRDSRATIRQMAVRSLSKALRRGLPAWAREEAVGALQHAAKKDRDRKVKRDASQAYAALSRAPAGGATKLSRVFIAIDTASDRSGRLRKQDLAAAQSALRASVRRRAPTYSHATPSEGLPTGAELSRSLAAGFYVKATVAKVDARGAGGGTEVACQVDIRVSSWDGADKALRMRAGEFASATGRGRVTGGSSSASVSASARDCVIAVIESVMDRQVVPFVKRQADRRLAAR